MDRVKISVRCHLQRNKLALSLFFFVIFCYTLSVWNAGYPVVSVKKVEKAVIREETEIREDTGDLPEGNSCDRILTSARLPETQNPWFIVKGCKLHQYSHRDAQTCMYKVAKLHGHVHIALNGDSRMRNLYASLTKFLGKVDWEISRPLRHSLVFKYYNPDLATLVTFFFHGHMNSVILNDYIKWEKTQVKSRPRVIIQGHAMWDLTFGGPFDVSLKNFKGNLSAVLPFMTKMANTTDILWMIQDPPDIRKLDWSNIDLRGPHRLNAFNKAAVQLLSSSPVKLWRTARTVALRFPDLSDPGGIHYLPPVIDYKVQLFFNWFCNRYMNFSDGTCCNSPGKTWPSR